MKIKHNMNFKLLNILFLLGFLITKLSAQTSEFLVSHDQEGATSVNDAYTIYDKDTKQTFLFLVAPFHTFLYVSDEHGEVINKKSFSIYDLKFTSFQAYALSGDHFAMVTSSKGKYNLSLINLQTGKCEEKPLTFDNKEEKHICMYQHNGKILMVNGLRKTNALKIYDIDALGNKTEQVMDLGKDVLFSYDMKNEIKRGKLPKSVIVDHLPVNIVGTREALKIYKRVDHLQISLDAENETRTVDIDLTDRTFKYYKNPIEWNSPYTQVTTVNNSFILDDHIFQVKSTASKMTFDIKDMETNTVKNSFVVNKGDDIGFSNTKIVQQGGQFMKQNDKRILNNSAQFLRKISAEDIAVCARQTSQGLRVDIGGVSEINKGSSGGMGVGMPGVYQSFGNVTVGVYFDPTASLYNSYKFNKVTTIKCLFDEEFKHKPGKISRNIFDKMIDFEQDKKKSRAVSIIQKENYILYGFYDRKLKSYKFLKFEH